MTPTTPHLVLTATGLAGLWALTQWLRHQAVRQACLEDSLASRADEVTDLLEETTGHSQRLTTLENQCLDERVTWEKNRRKDLEGRGHRPPRRPRGQGHRPPKQAASPPRADSRPPAAAGETAETGSQPGQPPDSP